MAQKFSLTALREAQARIAGCVHRTPCQVSERLSEMCGATVCVKFENLQATGSFKERGAANKLLQLSPRQRKAGVVTASAGNHGLGVACQARRLRIPAVVVMPRGAPLVKQTNVERLGARVVLHGDTYEEAVAEGRAIEKREKRLYIHGFDDADIVIGQGTLGLELIEDIPDLDAVIVPVGGGGLIAGVGAAIKALKPRVKVIGVEPERCASMTAALRARGRVTVEAMPTLADGLAVNRVGAVPLRIGRGVIDRMVTVSEDEIARAILVLLEAEKSVVEGAGAAPLAALLGGRLGLAGRCVALPLCGGNIDMNMMTHIIERGLAKDGRLVWLRTFASDRPGSLATISRLIADSGASVKDVYHNRTFGKLDPGAVEIDWILETRGHDHIAAITRLLRRKRIRVQRF